MAKKKSKGNSTTEQTKNTTVTKATALTSRDFPLTGGITKEITKTNYVKRLTPPFLPDDYLSHIDEHVKAGNKSPWIDPAFEKILAMTQSELAEHCRVTLSNNDYKVKMGNGFIYAEGSIPILLVAHLDTVHKHTPTDFIYKDCYLTSPQGIGGDDRCGVKMILNIIKEKKCHVLFCEDEEIGCVGAGKFASTPLARDLKAKKSINYIIELDRKGSKDCVFYDCDNKDFVKFIESTDYFKKAYGTCSDISYIAPALGVAATNLSSGYYQEHNIEEYIDMKALEEIETEVKKIIDLPCDKQFEYVTYSRWNSYGAYENLYTDKYYRYGRCYYDDEYDDFERSYGGKSILDDEYKCEFSDKKRDGNSASYSEYTSSDEDYRMLPSEAEVQLYTYEETKKSRCYHIFFLDLDGKQKAAEVFAINSDEAIGLFLQWFDYLNVRDIIDYYEM